MDRKYLSGASGMPPAAPSSPSAGYPTSGSPGVSPATVPGPYFYHMIMEELIAVITAGGLTPEQGTLNQLLQALPGALASRPEMAKSLSNNGYQRFPGGLIIQWGASSTDSGGNMGLTLPIIFPNVFLYASATYRGPSAAFFGAHIASLQSIIVTGNSVSQTFGWLAIGF